MSFLEESINFLLKRTSTVLQANQQSENSRTVAVIQPYVFPYIGYFQLIVSADVLVFYDDVNFIKKGWINRNRILSNGKDHTFTIPLKAASQNRFINEIEPMNNDFFRKKFYRQLEMAYKKAPYYQEVMPVIQACLNRRYLNIGDLAIQSILEICRYLNIRINWIKSSEQFGETQGMEKSDRLIAITRRLGAINYINPIGGQALYRKEFFQEKGVNLQFVQSKLVEYLQLGAEFIPNLSIIDLLMFNSKEEVLRILAQFELV